ncbi:hypothetical protein M413DRAFT_442777 [Hebeloma cylindrosporum]|uniref:Smr domain-containing protein n=1 Tax=Hebeloma cylindrosporum TaxID=76867 RepID=A0A0C3C7F8_HEBCY|nr:hypothetical protein M413DRAFT_442777 [Hebeloma cylindrosporum h7]
MDTIQSRTTLFDSLQKEFSPTIDSSLIAALLVEIESDIAGNKVTPTADQIDSLRATLGELSLQAEESQHSEFSDTHLASQFDETISSWTTPDNENAPTTGSSASSASSAHSFSSPLGFLQAALPEISTVRLNQALKDAEEDSVEMWDIIANILTEESIREMEERGLEGLDDEGSISQKIPDADDWEKVERKRKSPVKPAKRKAKAQKMALADIRQQHHIPPASHHLARKKILNTKHPPKHPPPPGSAVDPWTQVLSLSEHVATLLPQHPPSTFQSFFHSPKYATSYDALRAALMSICKNAPSESLTHTAVLYNLLDIIMVEYEESDDVHRSRIISDVELAVEVTQGKGDEALDLVTLLRELDSNADLGIYHVQQSQEWKPEVAIDSPSRSQLPSGPPAVAPPPTPKAKPKPPPGLNKPSPFQWQTVAQRRPVARGPHPLVFHIPAYSRDVNGNKINQNSHMKGGSLNANTDEFRRRMGENMRKRNEALLEASRMWQRGNSKTRGGEVAFYFAERAREFQEIARQEALNGAREMVLSKRSNSGNNDTIDLHGTTAAEAIVIVKEILNSEASSSISQTKPLKIITGRGKHSLNQVGVLKPAVRKALVEAGWSVSSWDGGLVVRQRQT